MDIRFLEAIRKQKIQDRFASLDKLASLFMFAWIIILLQGAIRKWILPGFSAAYLLEDIPILIAYIYALSKGMVWIGGVLYFCVGVSMLLCLQALLQVVMIHYNYVSAIMALHHYLFYLPMLFLLPVCMTRKNIHKFLRLNLLSIIPMSILSISQSLAPRNAWINQTAAGDDIGRAFGVSGDISRSSGTFNFTLPFSIWCGIAAALVIGEWMLPKERRTLHSTPLLLTISIGITLATVTSGSRTAIFLVLLALVGAMISTITVRNLIFFLRVSSVFVLVPAFAGMAYIVSPASVDALIGRFTMHGAKEEMSSRVVTMTIGFLVYPNFDLIGHGIGEGIPASEAVAHFTSSDPYWTIGSAYVSEWDNIRAVQGLGHITGIIIPLARFGAGFLLILAAFRALVLPGGQSWPHALPLSFTLFPTLTIGDMVHSAPVDAPLMYYCTALILSALLYRQERFSSQQISSVKAR